MENHIKGTYMSLIVRLSVRSLLTCKEEDLLQELVEILDAATKCLVQFNDEAIWISQLLWNISLKMTSGINSSRFFGRAAKLLPIDGKDRITCRIAQLGALIKSNQCIPRTDDVKEAIKDLTYFLEDYDESLQLKRLISVYRLKTLILMNAKEVATAVGDATRDADIATLEMFASLLSRKEHRILKMTTLRMAVTSAIRENDNAMLRCSYVLIEELINDLDVDGILDLVPEILTFSQSQIHSDEVQILTLMITTVLWNTSVRLAQANPYFEKSRQLKDVVSSLIHLMPKYQKIFDKKFPNLKV